MVKEASETDKINYIYRLLSSVPRMWIIMLIDNNPLVTISQLHQSVNSYLKYNYDYMTIHKNVKLLERIKVVRLEKKNKKQGQPVYVKKIDGYFWINVKKILMDKWEEVKVNYIKK